ncbi:MAG TPA: hypothetical protein VK806_09095 [Bacteroidia bacterium]|jgi:protein phosphatase 1 regulatory subunit 7|nr:hypothetical protein [Bacteroidia bacterium]
MLTRLINRITDPSFIDIEFIESELKKGGLVTVQFSEEVYTDEQLAILNTLCAKHEDNLEIRFYSHDPGSFECNTLLKIPNVKRLSLDCLLNAENIVAISQLNNLRFLSLGIFELKELDILKYENFKQLRGLIIGETRTKALDLIHLRDYDHLNELIICGHTKSIDAVGDAKNLTSLSLNSIKNCPITFVNRLKKLKTLSFILGGRENIHELDGNSIENLDIVWVRGFNDISNISNFRKLKTLRIEDEIKLKEILFDKEMPLLSDVKILNCKTLDSMRGIVNLTSLHQLRIFKTNLNFDSFVSQNLPSSLKIFAFYTWKVKQDKEIAAKLLKMRYTDGLESDKVNLN